MSYYGFSPYVPVAQRLANALKQMEKLKKKGKVITPIQTGKRKISKTFWGNAWCQHVESFRDYDNRLPRGRTLVRNGSVCHLEINDGHIEGIVAGSELYNVQVTIKPLASTKWENIKNACLGKIDTLLGLLSGELSDDVMQRVSDQHTGLFPQTNEIQFSCDCPDWAEMCKHVAAVLYGVGARLDHAPEKLFELRAVDCHELINTESILIDTTATTTGRRRLAASSIEGVFDIDFSDTPKDEASSMEPKKTAALSEKQSIKIPSYFSGFRVRKKRKELKLSLQKFAKKIGVSATTISSWEKKGPKKLILKTKDEEALAALWLP